MTASMTESWTMTRETGAMTRSPARASRPETRERIFSASVFARDELVVRDVDLHERGDELVELAELWQVVLLADRGRVVGIHPRHEAAERRNPVAFADPEHARVDVRGAAFEDRMAVRDRAA